MSPSADEIIESLAEVLIRTSIRRCLIDAVLSEHAVRMLAMRNATENAEDMIRDLTSEYNKARQNQITRELLDVIGGTGVLE
jgi:F-type H+-transporting ATPase subunit gamma